MKGFDEADLNGDGVVDASEFKEMTAKRRTAEAAVKEFNGADTDRDGKLTRKEWIAKYGSNAGFDEVDLNGDGVVDEDEFRGSKEMKRQATLPESTRALHEKNKSDVMATKDFESADTNKDVSLGP